MGNKIYSFFRLRENKELKQSAKYMKKYQDNDFSLTINRARLEDRGEYVVIAKNSYGSREEVVFLNVQSKFRTFLSYCYSPSFFRTTRSRTPAENRRTEATPEIISNASDYTVGRTRHASKIYVPFATSLNSSQSRLQVDLLRVWKTASNGKTYCDFVFRTNELEEQYDQVWK